MAIAIISDWNYHYSLKCNLSYRSGRWL